VGQFEIVGVRLFARGAARIDALFRLPVAIGRAQGEATARAFFVWVISSRAGSTLDAALWTAHLRA